MTIRQPIKQTRNVKLVLEQLEAKPVWNGGNVTRALANATGLEANQVGGVLTLLEERGYLYRELANGKVSKVTYYPEAPEPAPAPAPINEVIEDRAATALLNAMAKALQELTITNKAITVQLDFQREQLDFQAQELVRTQEEAAKLSSKLDYIASKSNSIAKAVKA